VPVDVIAREFHRAHFSMGEGFASVVQQPIRHYGAARERAVAHRVAAAQHGEAQVIIASVTVRCLVLAVRITRTQPACQQHKTAVRRHVMPWDALAVACLHAPPKWRSFPLDSRQPACVIRLAGIEMPD